MFFLLAEGYRLISAPSMSNTGSEQLEMGCEWGGGGEGWRKKRMIFSSSSRLTHSSP